jgi:hypothetical protein
MRFAAVLRSSSVLLLLLCKHIYCSGPAADNADLQPQGLAPGTPGVLVHQVCIVCVRTRFPVPVQLLCSAMVHFCAPVTPQIRNGNAQRLNARSLTSSSRFAVASFATGVSVQEVLFCCVVVSVVFVRASIAYDLHYRFIGEETEPARTTRQVYYESVAASTPQTNADRSTQHKREKHGQNTAHSLRRLSVKFAAYSHCSSGRMCKSCAHRTAPHRTAPHRTAPSASNIDSNTTTPTPTSTSAHQCGRLG